MAVFEVGPSNVRDVSYIAGNLRDTDKIEVLCQLPQNITQQQIGYICTRPGSSFIAYLDGKPVMVFGFDPMTLAGNVLNAWAFGTGQSNKVIHQLTIWLKDNLLRDWIEQGVTRIEARSFIEHVDAHGYPDTFEVCLKFIPSSTNGLSHNKHRVRALAALTVLKTRSLVPLSERPEHYLRGR